MGLQYALLFVCVATAESWALYERWTPSFHWTEKMTIKNPENNPTFNNPELGSLQDAWQVLEETSKNTYFLLFRTHVPIFKTCISATANITDKTNKIANYTIMIYDTVEKKYKNTTMQVRALNQTDYPLENVIRTNFKDTSVMGINPVMVQTITSTGASADLKCWTMMLGSENSERRLPNPTPVPPGSYTYAEYDNSTCFSRSTPFPDRGNAVNPRLSARDFGDSTKNALHDLFYIPESGDYADMYVVYNEPQCYILRSAAALGGCDFWLRKTDLKKIVDDLGDQIVKKEEELKEEHKEDLGIYENCTATDYQKELLEDTVEDEIERWFQDIVWKRISLDCVLAFMITCGAPVFRVYNPITCNTSLTGQ